MSSSVPPPSFPRFSLNAFTKLVKHDLAKYDTREHIPVTSIKYKRLTSQYLNRTKLLDFNYWERGSPLITHYLFTGNMWEVMESLFYQVQHDSEDDSNPEERLANVMTEYSQIVDLSDIIAIVEIKDFTFLKSEDNEIHVTVHTTEPGFLLDFVNEKLKQAE